MKKIIAAIAIAIFTGLGICHAERLSKINPAGKHLLSNKKANETITQPCLYLVKLNKEFSSEELDNLDVTILRRRDDLALITVPPQNLESLISSSSILRIEYNSSLSVHMDMAALYSNLLPVRNGEELSKPYTGKGVVVGFMDTGFDPNHINFLDENGKSRVAKVAHIQSEPYNIEYADTPEDIKNRTTDNDGEYHATHVAGILAGSCTQVPYTGVATDATIVATTSMLYDPQILLGLEYIVDYSKSQGKTAVINLSLGTNVGPHDGSTLMSQYLDKIGEEDALICVSAGNEGQNRISFEKTFTENDELFATALNDSYSWTGFNMTGGVDLWSDDSTPFDIELLLIDDDTKSIITSYQVPVDGLKICSSEISNLSADGFDDTFNKYYQGWVTVDSELNPFNNRFNTVINLGCSTRITETDTGWAKTFIGFRIKGKAKSHIYGYSTGCFMSKSGIAGFSNGDPSHSISDLATGENIISVGAYNTRIRYPHIDGSESFLKGNIGDVAYFSSYGTYGDKHYPDITAPGNPIVSSVSRYYNGLDENFKNNCSAKVSINSEDYYWYATTGTSMASPFVAGTIALWLEADPSLKVNDIKKIFSETGQKPQTNTQNPQWGTFGIIDCYKGLKYVLSQSGTSNVTAQPNIYIAVIEDKIIVNSLTDEKFHYNIIATDGKNIISGHSTGETEIDISNLSKGIYIISVVQDRKQPQVLKFVR